MQHPEPIAEPGRDVQLNKGRLLRQPSVRVRHTDGDALMQGEHELNVRVVLQHVDERLLGRTGVAKDVAHPVGDELLHEGALAGKARHGETPGLKVLECYRLGRSLSE